MGMEIKGKVIQVMPVQTGMGKKGAWHKQEFVLETPGQYPKRVCVSLWGEEKINKYDVVEGLDVTAHIELESREHAGRWYTEVRVWKMEWTKESRRWEPGASGGASKAPVKEAAPSNDSGDDLPF